MKRSSTKKQKTTAIVVSREPSPQEWKARALAAEAECAKYREAFGLLIAPFASYMHAKIDELVQQAVDDAISELTVDAQICR